MTLPLCYRCQQEYANGSCGCKDGICLIHGNWLDIAPGLPADSVDLVFGSPPYEDVRTYGIDFSLKGQEWVDWMVEVVQASLRVCRGLVAFVVEGKTHQFRWSATPARLMADLHRTGVHLRKPPVFHRVGIPGSGGPDWLRSDTEWIVCATGGGKLPWSDNTAMGHPPKWAVGGAMSNRTEDGRRINARTCIEKVQTCREADGTRPRDGTYKMPARANPANTIQQLYTADEVAALLEHASDVTHHKVGGGQMGDPLAHDNEAPFPESLCEFFIRSFCPPNGITLDPFLGSGTSMAVARKQGRTGIGIDIRESQMKLAVNRLRQKVLF